MKTLDNMKRIFHSSEKILVGTLDKSDVFLLEKDGYVFPGTIHYKRDGHVFFMDGYGRKAYVPLDEEVVQVTPAVHREIHS